MDFTKLATFLDPITGLANSALSVIRDKTKDPDTSFIQDKVRNGISVSSKRLINLTGTGAIITVALRDIMANGITWPNIALVGIGVAFSVGMAYMTHRSEK